MKTEPPCTHPTGEAPAPAGQGMLPSSEVSPPRVAEEPKGGRTPDSSARPLAAASSALRPDSSSPLLPGFPAGYRTILMDPPWAETGGGHRGADAHYPVHAVEDIQAIIRGSGVFLPHEEGCHLWCWATSGHLTQALWLIGVFGFRYVSTACWVKASGRCALPAEDLQLGLGQYMRHAHELLLLATRGHLPVPLPVQRPPSVICEPRTEHSRKPDGQYRLIEAVSPGPRLELFARRRRPGWDVWGNEV